MTCKDCKFYKHCTEPNKSKKYDIDGDSWANWCDDFQNKRKGNDVEYKGYLAIQTNFNWHITIFKDDKSKCGIPCMHISATKRFSKRKLKKCIKNYLKLVEVDEND